jgi:hypothetical protein
VSRKRRSSSSSASADVLLCPSCAAGYTLDERFCGRCGMPLVYAGAHVAEVEPGSARDRARKVRPEYTRGELVRVAGGRHQAEAELIQGILLEEGVPSILRRTRGFDVPDFLAAGPRDVLVPESGVDVARDLLRASELGREEPAAPQEVTRRRVGLLVAGILAGALAAALVAWALIQLAG